MKPIPGTYLKRSDSGSPAGFSTYHTHLGCPISRPSPAPELLKRYKDLDAGTVVGCSGLRPRHGPLPARRGEIRPPLRERDTAGRSLPAGRLHVKNFLLRNGRSSASDWHRCPECAGEGTSGRGARSRSVPSGGVNGTRCDCRGASPPNDCDVRYSSRLDPVSLSSASCSLDPAPTVESPYAFISAPSGTSTNVSQSWGAVPASIISK
jgi:hypothetical protein